MTNLTLILIFMQVVETQIHNGRFGLITAFIWGCLYSMTTPFTFDFVIHSLIGGGLSFIGGITLRFFWEKLLNKIKKREIKKRKTTSDMKKLLFIALMLLSSVGYSQTYTVVNRYGWICFDASVSRYSFKVDPATIDRPAIIYQDSIISVSSRPNSVQIKRQNFVSVDGVSCSGLTSLQILDRIRAIFSNAEKIHLICTSSNNGTDTAIPNNFRSGMIEWTNEGTGTVTVTTPDGKSTRLTANYPARVFPISDVVYSGYSIILAGGATIQWSFNQ